MTMVVKEAKKVEEETREQLDTLNTPNLMKCLCKRRTRKDELENFLWDPLRTLAVAWSTARKAASK